MKKKAACTLVCLLLLALCLTACGGPSAEAPSPAPDSGSGTAAPADDGLGNWPNDSTIKLVCGFSAGGSSDLMCRIFAEALGKELGQTVVVENMPGSGGHVSWNEMIKNVEPDGYTICVINSPGICICKEQPENPRDYNHTDFDLLGNHVSDYGTVCWKTDETRWTDFNSLLAYAREHELLYGTSQMTIGGDDYAFAEMMNAAFGTRFSAVITEGSKDNEVLLLNGSCDLLIGNIGDTLVGNESGTFRIGAVAAPERVTDLIPDVATVKEMTGEEVVSFSARGYATAPGTDPAILARLREATEAAITNPDTVAQMNAMGCATHFVTAEDDSYLNYMNDVRKLYLDIFGIEMIPD
ncbi:tripartite tricarboxylate transporter substrate binding protein [uncultured Oscillibacter sp.]|uniref:tripartite tricarboxylate transporter substrate binding protein n=1 Tax=uncultured Oscillibacter sp. TaxID=876091 RepID=UPI0028053116|nr:tripartite tricarboxylate transporter substrate binding protein [uncultured Oscillibacter sp.]